MSPIVGRPFVGDYQLPRQVLKRAAKSMDRFTKLDTPIAPHRWRINRSVNVLASFVANFRFEVVCAAFTQHLKLGVKSTLVKPCTI